MIVGEECPSHRATVTTDSPPSSTTTSAALRDVLDLTRIDPEANFLSLGGNSLLAVRIAGRLSRALGQRIPATAVLNHPTARDLARHLATQVSEPASPTPPTPSSAPADATGSAGTHRFPLSAAQRRVWPLHEVDPERLDHLVTISFEVTGELDPVVAPTAWHRVAERHEALRTRFEAPAPGGEEPCQVIESEPLTEFTFLDTVRFPEAVRIRIVEKRVALLRRTPLSLRTGPLSRIALLRTAPSRYRLELTVHHIVRDWSLSLLWQDFPDAYRRVVAGEPGPGPSPHRFSDHVRWERRTESARWPALADTLSEEGLPGLTLPVDDGGLGLDLGYHGSSADSRQEPRP